MSIRIPKGVDVDTYNAFRDIEQALEELKQRPAASEPPDVDALISRIEQLERKPGVDSDKDTFVGSGPQSGVGLVPSPGGTADNEAVLLENGTWGYPLRGLVRAVTKDGAVGEQQSGADVVNVLGHLSVLGGLSADSLLVRELIADSIIAPTGLVRRLNTDVSDVGNVGAGEDNLMSYTLPAGTLSADGQVIRVTARGRFATNANEKLLRAYFGATGILLTVAGHVPSNAGWWVQFEITRTGAATQVMAGFNVERDAAGSSFNFVPAEVAPAETLANAVVIKMTGEATSNDDILQKSMIVELLS